MQDGVMPIADVLSPGEIELALAGLTAREDAILKRGSEKLAFLFGFDSGSDLLQEAITRALVGKRKCPRALPVVVFLYKSMRSIAHSAAKARRRSAIVLLADVVEEDEVQVPYQGNDPADIVAAQEAMERIEGLFKDDVEVSILIDEMAKGLRGNALRDSLKVTNTELDTIRKRMHRRCKELAKPWRQP